MPAISLAWKFKIMSRETEHKILNVLTQALPGRLSYTNVRIEIQCKNIYKQIESLTPMLARESPVLQESECLLPNKRWSNTLRNSIYNWIYSHQNLFNWQHYPDIIRRYCVPQSSDILNPFMMSSTGLFKIGSSCEWGAQRPMCQGAGSGQCVQCVNSGLYTRAALSLVLCAHVCSGLDARLRFPLSSSKCQRHAEFIEGYATPCRNSLRFRSLGGELVAFVYVFSCRYRVS